jgi:succinyl-diaminopimelate desuccinylase
VLDPVALTQALIRCASVTPADAGAQDVVAAAAAGLGFVVHRLDYDGTPNLFARRGVGGPHLCFAGHTDVVPAGTAAWSADPFAADIREGAVIGRGACDMKGAVAAFLAAIPAQPASTGSVSLLITGDEEGPATGGTVRVLEWMAQHGHIPDFCLVGEPTNPRHLGEMVKIGRRGSINAQIAVQGIQGHVAYPSRVDNPVHRLTHALAEIASTTLDEGTDWFEPTSLQITSVDVGNAATNLVPAIATARLNIRFNDRHTGASLEAWLRTELARHADRFTLTASVSGEAFLTAPGAETERLAAAIESVTGIRPRMDTGGGTSDARFISRYCPVAEFGLVGATMHMADEQVPVADLRLLTAVYSAVLQAFVP